MNQTCLIVEDDPLHRKIVVETLLAFDFELIEAESGKKALGECKKSMPDLIILDWMMPEYDGIDFVKDLRAMKNGSKPYVIMVTAKGMKGNMANALASGVDTYIIKPFDPEEIEVKLLEAKIIKYKEF